MGGAYLTLQAFRHISPDDPGLLNQIFKRIAFKGKSDIYDPHHHPPGDSSYWLFNRQDDKDI